MEAGRPVKMLMDCICSSYNCLIESRGSEPSTAMQRNQMVIEAQLSVHSIFWFFLSNKTLQNIFKKWFAMYWKRLRGICALELIFVGKKQKWSCGGLNPGLLTCEASTLPLSYSPDTQWRDLNNFIHVKQWQSNFKAIWNKLGSTPTYHLPIWLKKINGLQPFQIKYIYFSPSLFLSAASVYLRTITTDRCNCTESVAVQFNELN